MSDIRITVQVRICNVKWPVVCQAILSCNAVLVLLVIAFKYKKMASTGKAF